MSVGSAAVGGDEDPAGVGVFFFADLLPPFFDGGYGEDRRVVVDADRDPGAVVGQVVDPIGYGFAVSLAGEVVGGHLDWFAFRVPFSASLGELPDQLLLFGVDADHGVACGEELLGEGVDVPELGIAVGVLVSFQGLAGPLETVFEGMEDVRDHRVADGVPHLGQLRREVTRRLRGPPQRRFGIPPCFGFNQRIQSAQQFRIVDFGFLSPASGHPDSTTGSFGNVTGQFGQTTSDRFPRRASGPLHSADSTPTPRFRLGRHRRTTIPLIQPRQQIRQACPHRLEIIVILGGHNANNFTGLIIPMGTTRHEFKKSLDWISYLLTVTWHASEWGRVRGVGVA